MKVTETWRRAREAESRLREARGIVDDVAAVCGISVPAHAFAMLNEEEQTRLYALLKGESK